MKRKWIVSCLIVIFVAVIIIYASIQKKHTFTLAANDRNSFKSEQIQPLFGMIKVNSDCDTSVVFTDVETRETYTIGYITSGVSEKIRLKKGRWYTVEGTGNLTITPVNVRIE